MVVETQVRLDEWNQHLPQQTRKDWGWGDQAACIKRHLRILHHE